MAFKNFKLDADMNLTFRIPAGAEFEPVTLRRRTFHDNADVTEFVVKRQELAEMHVAKLLVRHSCM